MTTWAEVSENPNFKMRTPEQQEATRQQYFSEVVAPNVPPEQLAAVKQQFDAETAIKFADTGGGAATGNPNIARAADARVKEVPFTAGERIGRLAGATGTGALVGAYAPEILTGLGAGAAAFGVTAPAAPVLFGAANAARIGRIPGAIAGAVSGAGADIAGQAMETTEFGQRNPMAVHAAELVGGFGAELKNAAGYGIKKAMGLPVVSDTVNVISTAAKKLTGGDPSAMSAAKQQYLEGLTNNLRGGEKSDTPMQEVYGALSRGGRLAQANANAEARGILAKAEVEAEGALSAAKTGPIARREEGILKLRDIGEKALETAQNARTGIGNDAEVGQIGESLRNVVVPRHQTMLKERAAAYKATEAERDAIVKAKESQGIYVESLPEYKALLNDIDAKLLITKKAQDAATGDLKLGKADVTEQGVRTAYQRIYDAVHRRRVPTGEVNEAGNPTYKEFATGFDAIDDVRRKLGDVIKGQPGEGYESISKKIAGEYYAKISDIQKKFVDGEKAGPQAKLQHDYADASDAIAQYNSKTGKRFTALDKYDDSAYATDASKLPKQFFSSAQGVKELIELTGDKAVVSQAARDYATNALRGKNESQVRTWMTANRDWLSAVPDTLMSVNKYADTLAQGERLARKSVDRVAANEKMVGALSRDAEKTSGGILSQADKQATGILSSGEQRAALLTGKSSDVSRVVDLINSGDRAQWAAAAPVIARDPAAKAALGDAIKQVLADKASKSPKGIADFYERDLRQFVERSGLLTSEQAGNLSKQLATIQALKVPEAQKMSMTQRLLTESLTGYGAAQMGASGANAHRQTKKEREEAYAP